MRHRMRQMRQMSQRMRKEGARLCAQIKACALYNAQNYALHSR